MNKHCALLALLAMTFGGCVVERVVEDEPTIDDFEPGESPDGPGGSGGGDDDVRLADAVVGAWYTSGTASNGGESISYMIGWSLCADKRLYGFTELDNFGFLDKGSYSVNEAAGSVSVTYRSKDTTIGDNWGPDSGTLSYDEGSDTLRFTDSNFGATLRRLDGAVDNSDCDPGF